MSAYSWARQSVPRGWYCVGDLADAMKLSPQAARQRLKRAGVGKLFVKRWCDPRTGRRFSRRLWGLSFEEYLSLLVEDAEFWTRVFGRRFTVLGMEPGPPLRGAERQAIWRQLGMGQLHGATKLR